MKKVNPYTGTFLNQRQERLQVRERYKALVEQRGLPRQVTFREINAAAAKEKVKR